MACRAWLERVAQELARRGVPAGRRSRLLGELRDHLEDLKEGGLTMAELVLEAALGRPEVVAAGAAEQYRRAGWVRRHPVVVFGLAPLPAAVAGLALYLLLAVGVAWVGGKVFGEPSGETRAVLGRLLAAYAFTVGLVPFALCALLFGRLATRHGVGRWWLALAVVQVALIAWAVISTVSLSDVPGKSSFMLGLRFPPWGGLDSWAALFSMAGGLPLMQFVLPLVVGMVFLWTAPKQEGA
ncbi:MAG: hypothetical protein U0797_16070 [Gemmataceae bacterium]